MTIVSLKNGLVIELIMTIASLNNGLVI